MDTAKRKELNIQRGQTILPELWEELEPVLASLEAEGYTPFIITGYRSFEEQEALYAQGREDLSSVNRRRHAIGLEPITEDENHRVTSARGGQSYHNTRRAIDICNYSINNSVEWENMDFFQSVWSYLGNLGWRWGKDFPYKDSDHFEK